MEVISLLDTQKDFQDCLKAYKKYLIELIGFYCGGTIPKDSHEYFQGHLRRLKLDRTFRSLEELGKIESAIAKGDVPKRTPIRNEIYLTTQDRLGHILEKLDTLTQGYMVPRFRYCFANEMGLWGDTDSLYKPPTGDILICEGVIIDIFAWTEYFRDRTSAREVHYAVQLIQDRFFDIARGQETRYLSSWGENLIEIKGTIEAEEEMQFPKNPTRNEIAEYFIKTEGKDYSYRTVAAYISEIQVKDEEVEPISRKQPYRYPTRIVESKILPYLRHKADIGRK